MTGTWREYEPSVSEVIEQAFLRGQQQVCSSECHVVYFHDMEQRDVLTDSPGVPRPVRRHRSFLRASALELLRRRNRRLREARRQAQAEERARIEARLAAAPAESPAGVRHGDEGSLQCGVGCRLSSNPLTGEVYVAQMDAAGPAALSGKVALGDVVLSVDAVAVSDPADAAERLLGAAATVVGVVLACGAQTAPPTTERVALLRQPPAGPGSGAGGAASGGKADCGVDLALRGGEVVVEAIRAGGAAAGSGLLAGDEVLAVDGAVLAPPLSRAEALDEARAMLRGPAGSRAVVRVARRGWGGGEAGRATGAEGAAGAEVAVVRAADLGDDALSARLAYQMALAEATAAGSGWGGGGSAALLAGGALAHTVRQVSLSLGEELHGSAAEAVRGVQTTLARTATGVSSAVGEKVERQMQPLMEQRWNALQLGSQVKGALLGALSSVVQPAVSTTRTIAGGVLASVVLRSGDGVNALAVNGDWLGGDGGEREARAAGVTVREIHLWKQQHGVRFLRLVFADGSELSGGVRGAGTYKGLRLDGGAFRVRYSDSRVLDISLPPGAFAGKAFSAAGALRDRPPAAPPPEAPVPARSRCKVAAEEPRADADAGAGGRWLWPARGEAPDPDEFAAAPGDEALWEALAEEGEPVAGDASVFRWRGRVLLRPFWSRGPDPALVVRAVPSGGLVYKGRPAALAPPAPPPPGAPPDPRAPPWAFGAGVEAEGEAEARDVSAICEMFPGRIGARRARQLLAHCGGDADAALSALLYEAALAHPPS